MGRKENPKLIHMQIHFIALVFWSFVRCSLAADSERICLQPTVEMDRAEVYIWRPGNEVRGVLVFCPGHNGSGESFIKDKKWRDFAFQQKVALCGLSFASRMDITQQEKGYSIADRGSGRLLLNLIDKEFSDKIPILMYGYSAGARFTASFAAWTPARERVVIWCASGVGRWPKLPEDSMAFSKGIVACGEYDATSYWNSLHFFQQGREKNFEWTWISLKDLGHSYSPVLDEFVRLYFPVIINRRDKQIGKFYDISTKEPSTSVKGMTGIFLSWTPGVPEVEEFWLSHHHP